MRLFYILSILVFSAVDVTAQSIDSLDPIKASIKENIKFLHEAPLKPNDPLFQIRYLSIMQALPGAGLSSRMETSLTSEYIRKYDGPKAFRYDQEVMIMYVFGQILYELEYGKSERSYESAYYALNYMLEFYKKLVERNPKDSNMLFERYLKERVKDELYAKMRVWYIPS